ncbi:unnamed protein product [Mytilus edulis]|uniref:Death domain-containing protein n=1 Tax=Mytilus edulis TaxID=6550 RepID=A0A8S3U5P4_MYTED|nr:unnamed protein product [Mytilus edulis]
MRNIEPNNHIVCTLAFSLFHDNRINTQYRKLFIPSLNFVDINTVYRWFLAGVYCLYCYKSNTILISANGEDKHTYHLAEALRVTAAEVGKNWTTLYRKLPFNPPRDKSNLDYDIEAIDWTRSTNTEYKDLAYKGLEKWRKLSNKASTNALIRTLNSMKKQSIAQQLQRTVIIT